MEEELIPGDVILFSKRHGPIAGMIKKRSGSYWSHTALVFASKADLVIGGPLIAETASPNGVEIHQLKKYTDRFADYDIGVRRAPGLDMAARRAVARDFVLNLIDHPYDYSRVAGMALTSLLSGRMAQRVFPIIARHFIHTKSFTCSTLVHKAYANVLGLGTKEPPLFSQRIADAGGSEEEVYAPADIARSRMFEWLFNPHE